MKFEELLVQLDTGLRRRTWLARRAQAAVVLPARGRSPGLWSIRCPSAPPAHRRGWARRSPPTSLARHPMQRLLQGDVGSGKTLVAALAMLQAAENGWQAAMMAPTEILAEQHWKKLSAWLEPLGIGVAWLSGSRKKRARGPARPPGER